MNRRLSLLTLAASGAVLVVVGAAAIQLQRPIPAPVLRTTLAATYAVSGPTTALPWPALGEAALYLGDYGWLGSSGGNAAVPIASVTKVMTALVVLRAHPLAEGATGPTVTVSAADVSTYQQERAAGDSVVPLVAGENLTELQLLEGLLLPSGDNLAQLLANWDAGSEPAFVTQMNDLAASLQLTHTHFADSSGLDPGSTSSARDLVTLAAAAMREPAFASIVAMPTASLPVAGTVHTYNPVLGQGGIVGVKTGWTAAAQGCLLFAASERVGDRRVQLLGAVIGQPGGPTSGLVAAGKVALGLVAATMAQLQWVQIPNTGALIGQVSSGWAPRDPIRLARPLQALALNGSTLEVRLRLRRVRANIRRGAVLGTATLSGPAGFQVREPVLAEHRLNGPSWWWRVTHNL